MGAALARIDAELGGAPEGLDALIVAERIKACLLYTSPSPRD